MRAAISTVVGLLSAEALACAVCGAGQGTQENEWAYLAMTGVLSLLPLAMMGGIAFWLFRRSQIADASASATVEVVVAPSAEPVR